MKKFKILFVSFLSTSLFLTGCNILSIPTVVKNTDFVSEADTVASILANKPTQITMLVDGTLVDQENGRDDFEASWEAATGIDLVILQPGHDIYYDEVTQIFENGTDIPDVVLLSSTYYTSYAAQGWLADIAPYYEGSELQSRIQSAGTEPLIDAIKIHDKLYGMTPTRGNGCVTYIKKAWLDRVGMSAPTNYDEYYAMLQAFTEGDPDGNGISGDTYGVSAAGIINGEAPYTNYLPEFYQDAYPYFYQKEDGTWADGFLENEMKAALARLQDAYSKGYIDKDIATNSTSNCRDKFYANEYGVFTYWAGNWAKTLSDKCIEAGINGDIVTIPPITETNTYLERVAPVWCITSACKNPEGVYKYFIETMLDGGEVEQLWTYRPNSEDYSKNHIDHMLAIVPLTNDPGAESITESQTYASNIFNTNSKMADLPYSTEAFALYNDQLLALKTEIINKVVIDGMDIDAAYSEFEGAGGKDMSQAIVDSLNAE